VETPGESAEIRSKHAPHPASIAPQWRVFIAGSHCFSFADSNPKKCSLKRKLLLGERANANEQKQRRRAMHPGSARAPTTSSVILPLSPS
jgi:hypothetical protein